MRTYLIRGLLVGLVAGFLAFGFGKAVGEPQIAKAEAFGETLSSGAEDNPVSRSVQDTFGLGVGTAAAGVALGGLFALAFASLHGRALRWQPRVSAGILAATAFVGVTLVPALKYPPGPPSVGNPDTLGHRTALYFVLIAFSVLAVAAAWWVARRTRLALAGGSTYVALVTLAYILMPGVDEVKAGFPASVLWKFRIASIGLQGVLWAAIGIGFGEWCERAGGYAPTVNREYQEVRCDPGAVPQR